MALHKFWYVVFSFSSCSNTFQFPFWFYFWPKGYLDIYYLVSKCFGIFQRTLLLISNLIFYMVREQTLYELSPFEIIGPWFIAWDKVFVSCFFFFLLFFLIHLRRMYILMLFDRVLYKLADNWSSLIYLCWFPIYRFYQLLEEILKSLTIIVASSIFMGYTLSTRICVSLASRSHLLARLFLTLPAPSQNEVLTEHILLFL